MDYSNVIARLTADCIFQMEIAAEVAPKSEAAAASAAIEFNGHYFLFKEVLYSMLSGNELSMDIFFPALSIVP